MVPLCARWLLAVALVACPALGLFEDEVGQYDWTLQQVGRPVVLEHSGDAADAKRVYVASSSGVVASVQLKDGALQWRRVATGDGSIKLLRAVGNRVLVSATDRGLVQAWKSGTGDLTWQHDYHGSVVDVISAGPVAAKQNIIVVRPSEVESRTFQGKHEWTTPVWTSGANFVVVAPGPEGPEASVCVVAVDPRGVEAEAAQLEVGSGKILRKVALPASVAGALQKGTFMTVGSQLVALSEGKLVAQPVCGDGESHTYELKKVKTSSDAPFQLVAWQRAAGAVFAATNGANTAVFSASASGLKFLRTFEGIAAVGPVIGAHDDEKAEQMPVAVAAVRETATEVQLLDPASGNVRPAMRTEGYSATDHGPIRLVLVRELSSGEHRMVVSAADHSFAAMQGSTAGKLLWSREEGLATIRQALFVGRRGSGVAPKAVVKDEPGILEALPAMLAQLSELPAVATDMIQAPMDVVDGVATWYKNVGKARASSELAGVMQPSAKLPFSANDLRDFGADKLIIAVSPSASKVFALECTTSAIVWQKYLGAISEIVPDAECPQNATTSSGCSLWMQELPALEAADKHALLFVMPSRRALGAKAASPQSLVWLEPLTGSTLHTEPSPAPTASIAAVMPFSRVAPQAKLSGVAPVVVIDTARRVHVMPGAAAAEGALAKGSDRLFYYEVDRRASVVQGYAVSQASGQEMISLWNLELSSGGEQIVATTSPEHREWDHVPVHIKGDASILYKYINENVFYVVSQDYTHKDKDGGDVSSLNFYALDTVTGHVLHQSRVVGGAGPVHLKSCDNWALMHYWNAKKTRFEILVVDFFDSKQDDGAWNLLFGKQQVNKTKSAHHLEPPVPLQQTYVVQTGVSALGVTATLRGITPRSLIMALTTDHVFRVSKDILNPRRPYTNGPKEIKDKIPSQFAPSKEEGVMPYSALVPLKPTDVLSHSQPVTGVNGIVSSPTALESTSLVFVFGLDLFFSPVQTAKGYDSLSPGFNYKLLYVSLAAVVVGVFASTWVAQYRSLQERWK